MEGNLPILFVVDQLMILRHTLPVDLGRIQRCFIDFNDSLGLVVVTCIDLKLHK